MNTMNTPANLKGMAKHTYNRVMSAMSEDAAPSMLHTFTALTDGAKAIVLQSGRFSNLYINGDLKSMTAEDAAAELTERAAGFVSRKLRKIDMVCAAAFLAEYISRQRKETEQPEPTTPDNTPSTMNTPETTAPEFSELSHAGQCLDIYLNNTREIYDRFTVPVISALVDNNRNNGGRTNWDNVIDNLCHLDPCEPLCTLEGKIYRAIDKARRLVRQSDGLTPTAQDIDQVTRNYAAYIVECAKYEMKHT